MRTFRSKLPSRAVRPRRVHVRVLQRPSTLSMRRGSAVPVRCTRATASRDPRRRARISIPSLGASSVIGIGGGATLVIGAVVDAVAAARVGRSSVPHAETVAPPATRRTSTPGRHRRRRWLNRSIVAHFGG